MNVTTRVAAVAAAAAAMTAAVPITPASALVNPVMTMSIVPGATSHRVCVYGAASPTLFVAAEWELAIAGSRAPAAPVNELHISGERIFETCRTIHKLAAPTGQYHVSFTFQGVGSDVVGKLTGFGSWQPALGDVVAVLPA